MSWWNPWKRSKPEPVPPSPEEQAAALAIKCAALEIRLLIKAIRKMSPEERDAFRKWVIERQKPPKRINSHVDD